jgi:hypothetical protein
VALRPLDAEEVGDGVTLIGLDVDGETVGRIGRHARLPRRQQVATGHGEQQQRGQAQRQRHGLDQGGRQAATQIRQPMAPAIAASGRTQAAKRGQHEPRH